jgi:hypothetical protein
MRNLLFNLCKTKNAKTKRISSYDVEGRNRDAWRIEPGEKKVIAEIDGPGCITHIWMTQGGPLFLYREVILKFYWDGEENPSILVPLGDFFCLGHSLVNSFCSLPFTASTSSPYKFGDGCALNCYLPMPFRKHAKIEIINEGKEHLILEAEGVGHYIGCNISVTNFHGTWWGEGDDMIWIDGYKWPPDLHGTGSEDYFNQAWGMQNNAFLFNGSSIFEGFSVFGHNLYDGKMNGGYQTSYIFHLTNPVHFKKSIKVTIEHGHGNHTANDYSSTAYWYQIEPHKKFDILPVEKRYPVLLSFLNPPSSQTEKRQIIITPEMEEMKKRKK